MNNQDSLEVSEEPLFKSYVQVEKSYSHSALSLSFCCNCTTHINYNRPHTHFLANTFANVIIFLNKI
jgi:hypothetical protein